jgi:hypothetical protein
MKRKHVTLAVLLAALSFFAAPSATAIPESQTLAIKKTVATVPAAELAARASDLVAQADKGEKEEVAVTTVREVASKRSATIVAVVGAIAKRSPELSVSVAAEAARLVAERATEIAKAAAAGAPSQADRIAAAVAKVAPKSATKVTRAVASVVPEQTTQIVQSVVSTVPTAKDEIAKDATISRLSQRMASDSGQSGIFTTLPGTIRGTPPPNLPPTDAGSPTAGADSNRNYGTP